jgi:hypothetical protein
MVCDLISGDEPVGDEGIVGVVQRDIVSNLWLTPIRVFTLGKKLINGIKGVGLHGIVGSIDNELRDFGLPTSTIRKEIAKVWGRRRIYLRD